MFEDGKQRRDFVHVHDVARACRAGAGGRQAADVVFNIGSGSSLSVREVARRLGARAGAAADRRPRSPASTARATSATALPISASRAAAARIRPRVDFETGIAELADWLDGQAAEDQVADGPRRAAKRGLAL